MIQIIGGSGFVGSFLINDLKDFDVQNLDKNPSPFFNNLSNLGNILDKKKLNFDKNVSFVVHLAAEHRDDVLPKSLYYDVNVNGTRNVLEAMDSAGIKNLIFTSSVAVYGLNKSNPDENHILDPFNHYGKSKSQAESIIREWYKNDPQNKSITIIRPTVIFGERNRGNVYNLFKQISSGRFIMIGNGENSKSMAYVRNITSFIKNRIEKKEIGYNVYNYADKPDYSMQSLTKIIEKKVKIKLANLKIPYSLGLLAGYFFDILSILTKKKYSVSSVRIKKFCATTQFNSDKCHSLFEAPFTLEEGINKTLNYEFLNKKQDKIEFYSE